MGFSLSKIIFVSARNVHADYINTQTFSVLCGYKCGMGTSQNASIALPTTTTSNTTGLVNQLSDLQARSRWVSRPNQRGKIDITWSCVVTLSICLWAMLHLNIPAETTANSPLFSVGSDGRHLLYLRQSWSCSLQAASGLQQNDRWLKCRNWAVAIGRWCMHTMPTV